MRSGARFPDESPEYREARERLLAAEIELRRATEAAASARRGLPQGGPVPEDYELATAGPGDVGRAVRFSALFEPGRDVLLVYSLMFSAEMERPCDSCTSIVDSLDGAADHVAERASLAVVAKSPPERIAAHAADRGWRRVRFFSSAGTGFNRDYLAEDEDGSQLPMLNAFVRDGDGVRHFWGTELLYAPWDEGQEPRHVDFIWPVWNLLDATPVGRGTDWQPALSYAER